MADETKPAETAKPKKLPTIAIVGIGCLGVLVLIGVGLTIAGHLLLSKFGSNLIKQGIESKTGVSVNTNDKTGSLSLTDSKTGESVNIGDQKIPDNFPKDFPLYPGAKPSGSLSGNNQKEQSQGYWIVMSTPDTLDKVKAFYDSGLKQNGWSVDNTMTLNESVTYMVKKGDLSGGVTVNRGKSDKETTITISLATASATDTPEASQPTDPPADSTSGGGNL
jgi:hypothetical protein